MAWNDHRKDWPLNILDAAWRMLHGTYHFARPHVVKPVDIAGLHYVVRIFIGCCISWILLGHIAEINPLWAVVSLITVTEPQMKIALSSFQSRAVNTIIGTFVGLVFLLIFGIHTWLLPVGAAIAAFFSVHVLNMQQGWRVGPITAVLVMSAGLVEHSTQSAVHIALERALGVLTGSFVALLVTWLMSMIWMPPETMATTPAKTDEPPLPAPPMR